MEQKKAAAVSSIPGIAPVGERGDAGVAREELIETLATWGAGSIPGGAEILEAIASFGAPERLRSIHQRAASLLSASLAAQIAETVELMETGASWKAPSFRARLDGLLENTALELVARVEGERVETARILAPWAGALEWEEAARMINALWRAEPGAEAQASLAALEALASLRKDLAAAREKLRAGLERRVAATSQSLPETRDALKAASEALRQDDPMALARCAAVLSRLDGEASVGLQSEESTAARERLSRLCEQGLERLTDTSVPLEPAEARFLEEALTLAGRATAIPAEGNPALTSVLGQWEAALHTVLEEAGRAAAEARSARQDAVEALLQDLERVGLSSPDETTTLRDRAAAGGAAWLEGVTRALGSITRREKELADAVSKASGALRSACEQMTSLLEKGSARLPVARVVQTRLWLEQVDGVIAEKDVEGIGSLAASLNQEARDLKGLSELAGKRRHSQEEGERDTVKRALARLTEVMEGKQAAALEALVKQVAAADAAGLSKIRERAAALGAEVESALRFEATMLLHQAARIVGTDKAGKAGAVAKVADAARAALLKDDLPAVRATTSDLRQAVHAAAPLTRPGLKLAAGAVAAALVIAGAASVRFFSSGPASFRLVLTAPPASPVTLKLLRGGGVAAQASYGPGDSSGVTLRLPDGRYEIYINDRFTGRAFQVPGEAEITGIPLPAASKP